MTARINSVTQAREAQCAHDVSNVAMLMPPVVTSGETLLALSRAWKAGHRAGFDEGFLQGQKHMAATLEAVQGLIP